MADLRHALAEFGHDIGIPNLAPGPQGLGGAGQAAAVLAQGLSDQGALKGLDRSGQRLGLRRISGIGSRARKRRSARRNAQHHTLCHVAQLAHVAGPVVGKQHIYGRG